MWLVHGKDIMKSKQVVCIFVYIHIHTQQCLEKEIKANWTLLLVLRFGKSERFFDDMVIPLASSQEILLVRVPSLEHL